jgi:GAF domain-containing protein
MLAILINGLIFIDIHGASYLLTIYVVPLMIGGLIFNLTVYGFSYLLYQMMKDANGQVQENSRSLALLKEEADLKHARLESYIEAMNRMSRGQAVLSGDLDALFAQICESAVAKLGISRVSIWELTDEYIERKYLFEQRAGQELAIRLYQRDFPQYFQAIRTTNLVSADYAETHPDTCEFADQYLRPLNIVSMLDVTFSVEDRLAGLICCESQHTVRHWTAEDRLFVQSLAGLVSVGYNSYKAQAFLEQIRLQNKELHAQRLHIEEINRALKGSNETLEEHVQERTRKLEEQNAQLTEYAFINSHLLRAPLARILGVASIIAQAQDENKPVDPVLLHGLIRSGDELDEIIRTISKLLYEGKDFTRKEVEEIVFRKLNPGEHQPDADGIM